MSQRHMTLQQEAALALDRNIVVSAGAGSGKTWVLVQRYLTILDQVKGIMPRNIVAITFTRKAAAEMRQRIRDEIRSRLEQNPDSAELRRRYVEILDELSRAPINTIHGFAADILREFAIPAGLDPGFTVLEDDKLADPVNRSINTVINLVEKNNLESYCSALQLFNSASLRSILGMLAGDMDIIPVFERQMETPVHLADMIRDRLGDFSAVNWLRILKGLPSDENATSTKTWDLLAEGLERLIHEKSQEDLQSALALIHDALFSNSGARGTSRMASLRPLVEELQGCLEFLPGLKTISEKGENYARIAGTSLLPLLRSINIELDQLRQCSAMVTFDDLENLTWKLLTEKKTADIVVPRLRQRYQYFMIDEFQDTNLRQWELIKPLVSDDSGDLRRDSLFIVGDPKQSIYGFRNADVTVFNQVKQLIIDANQARGIPARPAEVNPGDIHMDSNFRSRPAILSITDAVCSSVMKAGKGYEVVYETMIPKRDLTDDFDDDNGQVAVLAPATAGEDSKSSDEEELSGGTWLDLMIGHLVETVENERFNWGDIAVMYPARTRLTEVKRGLLRAGVPYKVYKGIGFWQRPEVGDLIALIKWLADPGNITALYTVLRSPMFSLSDSCLLLLAENKKAFPDKTLSDEILRELTWSDRSGMKLAQELLIKARRCAGILPLSRILEFMLSESGGWGAYAADDDSGQADSNIEKLLDLVTGLDREGVAPLWETAEGLAIKESDDTREGEAMLAGSDDRVTLLTIHAAKGLEFPVVYLLDLERRLKGDYGPVLKSNDFGVGFKLSAINPEMSRYETVLYSKLVEIRKDRERAEHKRLLYVAFTRARDRLYLVHRPQRGKILQRAKKANRWLDWILDGMDRYPVEVIQNSKPVPARKTETLDLNSVERMIRDRLDITKPVPDIIDIIPKDTAVSPIVTDNAKTDFSMAVTSIRSYIFDRDEYIKKHVFHMVDHFRSPDSNPNRETARRLGDAYHQLMELHPNLDESSVDVACKKLNSELVGVNEEDQKITLDRLRAMATMTKKWSLHEKITGGKGLHEVPFNIYLNNGTVHGIIDLLIKVDNIWHVIDYKTDHKPPNVESEHWKEQHRNEHLFQMSVYGLAASQITGSQSPVQVTIYLADLGDTIQYEFSGADLGVLREKLEKILEEMKSVADFPE